MGNVLSLPGSQPFKRAKKTRPKSTSFQERQNGSHLTPDLGQSICGVSSYRDPVQIVQIPLVDELLNSKEVAN